jgi:hypothetical protein
MVSNITIVATGARRHAVKALVDQAGTASGTRKRSHSVDGVQRAATGECRYRRKALLGC